MNPIDNRDPGSCFQIIDIGVIQRMHYWPSAFVLDTFFCCPIIKEPQKVCPKGLSKAESDRETDLDQSGGLALAAAQT